MEFLEGSLIVLFNSCGVYSDYISNEAEFVLQEDCLGFSGKTIQTDYGVGLDAFTTSRYSSCSYM